MPKIYNQIYTKKSDLCSMIFRGRPTAEFRVNDKIKPEVLNKYKFILNSFFWCKTFPVENVFDAVLGFFVEIYIAMQKVMFLVSQLV